MASSAQKLAHNLGAKGIKCAFIRLGDDGESTSTTDVYIGSGTGVPSGAYNLPTGATALYMREDASNADACLYVTHNAGTAWAALADSTALTALLASNTVGEGAALIGIQDAGNFYTGTTVEAALAELDALLGSTTSTTYNFTNGTGSLLTDNDSVYAALNKLDQGFVNQIGTQDVRSSATPTFDGVKLASDPTANGTGVALTSEKLEVRTALVTLTNVDIALTDEAGVVAYGGLKILDMPAGAILFLGAVADIDVTKSSAGVNADWDGDFGIGTVTASNNGTLSGTEQDILPTTATPQAVAGVTTANGQSTITQAGYVVDGTGTAVDVFLNFLVDDADHDVTGTPCNLILNGTVKITYCNLGDY